MFNLDHAIEPSRALLFALKCVVSLQPRVYCPTQGRPTHLLATCCWPTGIVALHCSLRSQVHNSITRRHRRPVLVAPAKFPLRETVESLLQHSASEGHSPRTQVHSVSFRLPCRSHTIDLVPMKMIERYPLLMLVELPFSVSCGRCELLSQPTTHGCTSPLHETRQAAHLASVN